jgi:hypothetical protein
VAESERRQVERFSLQMPALISMMNESVTQKPFEVITQNISSGGAFFITNEPILTGTHLEMDLILSSKKDAVFKEKKTYIHVSGAVVRTGEHGLAVCFDKKYFISPLNS